MQGFDKKWKDFPDYILGITHEIWEERDIASLHRYYAPDIIVRSPASVVRGNHGVIAATLATLHEFPDRELLGEDVIWSGTPEAGMLSSHRLLCTATHTGDGVYGKATGTKLRYRVIADCHAKNNVIDDEWLIRDQGAIMRQLGVDPREHAAASIEAAQEPPAPFTPQIDIAGPYNGRGNDGAPGRDFADILTQIMNADITAIKSNYDRAANLCYPGGLETQSYVGAETFWMGLRASFPSAKFEIHHQIGREDPMMAPRAAIRWSLRGKHDGWGHFGRPTGADVYVMGASHVEFGPWGIRREYTLYDEVAIWTQIIAASG